VEEHECPHKQKRTEDQSDDACRRITGAWVTGLLGRFRTLGRFGAPCFGAARSRGAVDTTAGLHQLGSRCFPAPGERQEFFDLSVGHPQVSPQGVQVGGCHCCTFFGLLPGSSCCMPSGRLVRGARGGDTGPAEERGRRGSARGVVSPTSLRSRNPGPRLVFGLAFTLSRGGRPCCRGRWRPCG